MNNCLDRIRWSAATLLLLLALVSAVEHDSVLQEDADHHVVVKLMKRDDALATTIAREHGLAVMGEPFMDSYYHMEHVDSTAARRRKRSVTESLSNHPNVHEHFISVVKRRSKRDYASPDLEPRPRLGDVRRKRQTTNLPIPKLPFPDPLYNDQWYLIGGAVGGYDMNVREAWLLGFAGRNVSVSILDDGIQRDHPDLAENYDPLASTDINDNDDDPTPQNNGDNKHGTRCAGEVGALAGNDQCGVGVAFKCKIGGVRMLDGPVSDAVEARSLALNQQHIDIYSASWGPEDDGKTFDGPGPLAREAFYRGIKQGRGGKGNIFVWASGNGGSRQDSCSADGYTTSIYTLSISSATFDNHRPWYLEECPSTIATTYSSANINQPAIVTVDVPSGCTKMHTGTSASAPLAAGIIALALEANPSLTWRDMQHLVLRTANPMPLLNNPGWSINGVGRRISNKFGYGLMDAGKLVKLARVWETVPEQHLCTYEYRLTDPSPRPLTGRFSLNFTLDVNGCNGQTPVLYLEHVQVVSTIRYGKRGDLRLTLISPKGTKSVLLPERPQDFNSNGFHKWPFLSVHMWGEDPRGTWTLIVESVTNNRNVGGTFHDWTLLLYGTESPAQSTDPKYDPLKPSKAETSFLSKATDQLTSQISVTTLLIGLQLVAVFFVLLASFVLLLRMRVCCCRGSRMPPESQVYPETALSADAPPDSSKRPKSKKKGATSEEPSQTISQGDLRSAQNCHPECQGCSEPQSATSCFACRHLTQTLRNRAGFRCVNRCEDGFYMDGDKCKACSAHCKTCTKAEVCATCPGAQLLIDVDHYGHFDHGQCVEKCPSGLIADYDSNLIQARCVLKKNPCETGYYQLPNGNCVDCDSACKTCHGAGALQCDECATGYSNRTIGYCRPCCAPGEDPSDHHCEDCSKEALAKPIHSETTSMLQSFAVTVAIVFVAGCVFGFFVMMLRDNGCFGGGDPRSNIDYTPLPNYSGDKLSTMVDSSDSELDDEIFDRVKIDSASGTVSVEK